MAETHFAINASSVEADHVLINRKSESVSCARCRQVLGRYLSTGES